MRQHTPRWWILNVAVPAITTLLLAWYTFARRSQFEPLGDAPILELSVVIALTVAGFAVNGLEFGLLYRTVGAPIGLWENWALFSAGQAGNYLPGQLGTLYRFRYLKVIYGLPYPASAAAYSANFVISVFATGVVGLVGCVGLLIVEGTWSLALTLVLAGLTVAAALAAILPSPTTSRSGRIGSAWMRLNEGWDRARRDRGTALAVLVLEIVRFLLLAARLSIVFGWLGVDESFLFFLVVGPITALATFIAVTPAGLGIRELALAAAVTALGRTFDVGLLGSTADRAVSMVVAAVTGLIGISYTARRLGANEER